MFRNHVDLFSGIGGFAIAAEANGVETIHFCESDERCRKFLERAWPGIPVWPDIRTFRWESGKAVWLLTGGPPCQPVSFAGRRLGEKDCRWLWEEALRLLAEIRPAWVLYENPVGLRMLGLDRILTAMEDEGYVPRVFNIPACAVGAPHQRQRYWIVGRRLADADEIGRYKGNVNEADNRRAGKGWKKEAGIVAGHSACSVADANEQGCKGSDAACGKDGLCSEHSAPNDGRTGYKWGEIAKEGKWDDYLWISCPDNKIRRVPGESFDLAHGLHRSVLRALGNSIVPQVAAKLIRAMILSEEQEMAGESNTRQNGDR